MFHSIDLRYSLMHLSAASIILRANPVEKLLKLVPDWTIFHRDYLICQLWCYFVFWIFLVWYLYAVVCDKSNIRCLFISLMSITDIFSINGCVSISSFGCAVHVWDRIWFPSSVERNKQTSYCRLTGILFSINSVLS